jgi:hypothetical protein
LGQLISSDIGFPLPLQCNNPFGVDWFRAAPLVICSEVRAAFARLPSLLGLRRNIRRRSELATVWIGSASPGPASIRALAPARVSVWVGAALGRDNPCARRPYRCSGSYHAALRSSAAGFAVNWRLQTKSAAVGTRRLFARRVLSSTCDVACSLQLMRRRCDASSQCPPPAPGHRCGRVR